MLRVWSCAPTLRLFSQTVRSTRSTLVQPQTQIKQLHSSVGSKTLAVNTGAPIYYGLQALLKSSNRLLHFGRPLSGTSLNANTNLAKDVIIYKYENPRFFKYLGLFAYSQFLFWGYMSHFAFTELRDVPINPDELGDNASWYQKINLGADKNKTGISIFCFLIGYSILALAWVYTLRSVRFLVLRKGGRDVTMVMYGPFGKNRMMDVPLSCMSAQDSRQAAKVIMPLKIKGARMFYMLDMRGEFLNTKLFDHTVGLKRRF